MDNLIDITNYSPLNKKSYAIEYFSVCGEPPTTLIKFKSAWDVAIEKSPKAQRRLNNKRIVREMKSRRDSWNNGA